MENLFHFKHLKNDEKVKSFSKRLAAVVMAGVMGVSMVTPAVAAPGDVSTLETSLYKDGLYDGEFPEDNLSMGDGAVLDTDYKEVLVNGVTKYYVTVKFAPSFKAHGINSHLTEVKMDLNDNGNYADEQLNVDYFIQKGGKNDNAVIGYSFYSDSVPTTATLYDAQFTIEALKMPIGAEGDLVILPNASIATAR